MKRKILDTKSAIEALKIEANNLSRFDGDMMDYDGDGEFSDYDGDGDTMLDFDGKVKSFVSELNNTKQSRIVAIAITNNNATDEVVNITGGLKLKAEAGGIPNGLLFVDGNNTAESGSTVVVGTSPQPFEIFRRNVEITPLRVVGVRLSSTNMLQLEEAIDFEINSPYVKNLKSWQIRPSDFVNEMTYRDSIVTIPEAFQLDAKTRMTVKVLANSTLKIVLYVGAELSIHKALHKKAAKAYGNMSGRRALQHVYSVQSKLNEMNAMPKTNLIGGV
jgi:hypothetical protein